MIYIITEKSDLVTDLVTEWLVSFKSDFKRFNDNDPIKNSDFLHSDQIKKIWQRRGSFNFFPLNFRADFQDKKEIVEYLHNEIQAYRHYLENHLKNKLKENYIGSYIKEVYSNNKLINLDIAQSVGLKTPDTLVTFEKQKLKSFFENKTKIITKDLRNPANIRISNGSYNSVGVQIVVEEMLDALDEHFCPIFVQELIEKKYEVRIFIIANQLYAMAIFSQQDEQTRVDYRNYNSTKPNRCVPVKLPELIEQKIWAFMNAAEINTGSIDLIVTPDNEYYFLEINPMGQFQWLSANCNYYIENHIAEFLAEELSQENKCQNKHN